MILIKVLIIVGFGFYCLCVLGFYDVFWVYFDWVDIFGFVYVDYKEWKECGGFGVICCYFKFNESR